MIEDANYIYQAKDIVLDNYVCEIDHFLPSRFNIMIREKRSNMNINLYIDLFHSNICIPLFIIITTAVHLIIL